MEQGTILDENPQSSAAHTIRCDFNGLIDIAYREIEININKYMQNGHTTEITQILFLVPGNNFKERQG
jgi:hypothetical protein